MNAITISKERGHEFEGEWWGSYGRFGWEEREERNVVTKLQSQKLKTNKKDFEQGVTFPLSFPNSTIQPEMQFHKNIVY